MANQVLDSADGGNRPQSQASLNDQLRALCVLANQWGYYDAADFIRRVIGDE